MLGKDKEKNLYSMLIAVWALFAFIVIVFTYGIVDYKIRNISTNWNNVEESASLDWSDSEKLDKILNLQYAQIWGETNYDTVLKISELSKDKTKAQMDKYLSDLENGEVPEQPSNAPAAPAASPSWNISLEDLAWIKKLSYIEWSVDAEVTWLEYSDLECPFCARLHNSWTVESVKAKYGEKVNIVYNHFPLGFHANALPWAQLLECAWELGGSDKFYAVMSASYKAQNSTRTFLVNTAVELWLDKAELESCVDSWKYAAKVQAQMATWTQKFGVTWTPWNVLINNKTGEYKVLSWALPYSSFEVVIDELLK